MTAQNSLHIARLSTIASRQNCANPGWFFPTDDDYCITCGFDPEPPTGVESEQPEVAGENSDEYGELAAMFDRAFLDLANDAIDHEIAMLYGDQGKRATLDAELEIALRALDDEGLSVRPQADGRLNPRFEFSVRPAWYMGQANPQYEAIGTVRLADKDAQPRLTPQQIVNARQSHERHTPEGAPVWVFDGKHDHEFVQFGRALALHEDFGVWRYVRADGVYHTISNQQDGRCIRVAITKAGALVEELSDDGNWNAHPMQKTFRVWTTPPMQKGVKVTFVGAGEGDHRLYYNDFTFRPIAQQNGGEYSKALKAWKFVGELPVEVANFINRPSITKYHFLVKLLTCDVHLRCGSFDPDAVDTQITDGFRRELWRVCGYDYRDFPKPVSMTE